MVASDLEKDNHAVIFTPSNIGLLKRTPMMLDLKFASLPSAQICKSIRTLLVTPLAHDFYGLHKNAFSICLDLCALLSSHLRLDKR